MTVRKKIILSIASMCFVVVVGVGAVIAVFAAASNNTDSNIVASYTATQIAGKVSAKYGLQGDNNWSNMYIDGDANNDTKINFSETTEVVTGELSPTGEIQLLDSKLYAVLRYEFKNDSTQYNIDVTTTHTDISEENYKNVMSFMAPSNDNLTIEEAYTFVKDKFNTSGGSDLVTEFSVEPNSTKYYYAYIEIVNIADDSYMSIELDFNLTQGEKVSASLNTNNIN